MGKISKVFYKELDPHDCSQEEASQYQFYMNTIGLHPMFATQYEEYEIAQVRKRNEAIGAAIVSGEISNPKVNNTIFGISSLRDRVVIITEL